MSELHQNTAVILSGSAKATAKDGSARILRTGDAAHPGETLTAIGAEALLLANGNTIELAPNQPVAIDDDTLGLSSADTHAVERASVQALAQTVIAANPEAGAFDPNAIVENDATAAGAGQGAEHEGGHSFVELLRLVETVESARYEFPLNPHADAPSASGDPSAAFLAASAASNAPANGQPGEPRVPPTDPEPPAPPSEPPVPPVEPPAPPAEPPADPGSLSLGTWFIAHQGNGNAEQAYAIAEGSKHDSFTFNVQVQGHAGTLEDGASVKVAFDLSGTAKAGEDYFVSVSSKHHEASLEIAGTQLIVTLSGGHGSLNGLPFEVTVTAAADSDAAPETANIDIATVTLYDSQGRAIETGSAWESNDSVQFTIESPSATFHATAGADLLGSDGSIGGEIFQWSLHDLSAQTDVVKSFGAGDTLDLSDVLSSRNHTFEAQASDTPDGTVLLIVETGASGAHEPLSQEILLAGYHSADPAKLAAELIAKGSVIG